MEKPNLKRELEALKPPLLDLIKRGVREGPIWQPGEGLVLVGEGMTDTEERMNFDAILPTVTAWPEYRAVEELFRTGALQHQVPTDVDHPSLSLSRAIVSTIGRTMVVVSPEISVEEAAQTTIEDFVSTIRRDARPYRCVVGLNGIERIHPSRLDLSDAIWMRREAGFELIRRVAFEENGRLARSDDAMVALIISNHGFKPEGLDWFFPNYTIALYDQVCALIAFMHMFISPRIGIAYVALQLERWVPTLRGDVGLVWKKVSTAPETVRELIAMGQEVEETGPRERAWSAFHGLLEDERIRNAASRYAQAAFRRRPVDAVLDLCISLEMLLSVSTEAVSQSVARRYAALLAEDDDEFDALFKELKKLYDVRSKIVHGGDYAKSMKDFLKFVARTYGSPDIPSYEPTTENDLEMTAFMAHTFVNRVLYQLITYPMALQHLDDMVAKTTLTDALRSLLAWKNGRMPTKTDVFNAFSPLTDNPSPPAPHD